jgi:hypothetical protein
VAGCSRRLRNEELHNLYVSPNILRFIKSRRMGWVRHVARMGYEKYQILFGKLKGKRPQGRPTRRW